MQKAIYILYIFHAVCVALLILNTLHEDDSWWVKFFVSIAAIAEIVFTIVYILASSS